MATQPQPLTLLIDASSLIYRAFFSTPENVKSPGGISVNAAHGFINMLARLVSDRDPDYLACATDEDWRPQWRVDLIPSYKTHRTAEERTDQASQAEDQLEVQIPIIFELLEMVRFPVAGCQEFEAEDVIGALAARSVGRVEIVSGDRDLFQMIRDPDICVLYPRRGVTDPIRADESYIQNKYQIPGRAYGDFALLRGDPSDGLPGVPGIGEKTAAQLITKFGSLEKVIEAAITGDGSGPLGKVKGSLEYLDRAVKVVLISPEVPLGRVDMTRPRDEPDDSVWPIAQDYGLDGPLRRLVSALRGL